VRPARMRAARNCRPLIMFDMAASIHFPLEGKLLFLCGRIDCHI
jgi:hypothetical protein